MKKTLITLHRWIGFPLGLIFIITFATGSLTAIDELLSRMEYSQQSAQFTWQKSTPAEQAAALNYLFPLYEKQQSVTAMAKHKNARQVKLPSPESPYYRVSAKGESWIYPIDFLSRSQPISPLHQAESNDGFFKTVLQLHRNLLLGKEGLFGIDGKYYVAWTALISLFISLLGVWLWWPRRNTFKSKDLVPRANKRKHYYLSHMTSGVVVLIVIILMGLTGASISYRDFTQQLFGIEKSRIPATDKEQLTKEASLKEGLTAEGRAKVAKRDSSIARQTIQLDNSWLAWITAASAKMPEGAQLQQVRLPRARGGKNTNTEKTKARSTAKKTREMQQPALAGKKPKTEQKGQTEQLIEFRFYDQGDWFSIASSKVFIAPKKSSVETVQLFSTLPANQQIYSLLKPLHTGHDLPIAYVLIVLLLSLLGTMMVLSGVISFIIKKRKFKKLKAVLVIIQKCKHLTAPPTKDNVAN